LVGCKPSKINFYNKSFLFDRDFSLCQENNGVSFTKPSAQSANVPAQCVNFKGVFRAFLAPKFHTKAVFWGLKFLAPKFRTKIARAKDVDEIISFTKKPAPNITSKHTYIVCLTLRSYALHQCFSRAGSRPTFASPKPLL
jgi:hypothetical protein